METVPTDETSLLTSSGITGKETKNTVVLALSFHSAFTAYGAIQNLQSSLNEEADLGVISLAALYGMFIFSGILSPTIIRFLGVKNAIVLAWIGHSLYTASNFYPAFATLIPSSVILGGVSGLLWTSQSIYVTACAYSLSKRSGREVYEELSKLLGLFFTISELNGVSGNLISSLVLQQGTSGNITQTEICGAMACPSSSNSSTLEKPEQKVVYILLGIYEGFDLLALALTVFLLSPLPRSYFTKTASVRQTFTSFFAVLSKSRLILLLPYIVYSALSNTFMWADYTKSYISCPLGIQMVGFVMVCYNFATSLFAFLFGRIANIFGSYVLLTFASLVQGGLVVFFYFWQPTDEDTVYIFLLAVAWAVGEGVWLPQLPAILGLHFPEQKEAIFANLYSWKSVGYTFAFAVGGVFCVQSKLLMLMVSVVLSWIIQSGVTVRDKCCDSEQWIEYEIIDSDSQTPS